MTATIDLDDFSSLPDMYHLIKNLEPQNIENVSFIRERRYTKGNESPSQNLCTAQFDVKSSDSKSSEKYKMTLYLADSKARITHNAIEFTINDKSKVIANPSFDLCKKTVNAFFELIEGSLEQSIYDISGGDLTFLD